MTKSPSTNNTTNTTNTTNNNTNGQNQQRSGQRQPPPPQPSNRRSPRASDLPDITFQLVPMPVLPPIRAPHHHDLDSLTSSDDSDSTRCVHESDGDEEDILDQEDVVKQLAQVFLDNELAFLTSWMEEVRGEINQIRHQINIIQRKMGIEPEPSSSSSSSDDDDDDDDDDDE